VPEQLAVALGLDPVTAYSASAPLPKHIDELMFAGFLRGVAEGEAATAATAVHNRLPKRFACHSQRLC